MRPGAAQLEVGTEWIVEAFDCDPERLRSEAALRALFDRICTELELRLIECSGCAGAGQWHAFPGEGGVTGMLLLTESHLTCHTFPERRYAALNIYCCRPRPRWPFETRLGALLGAKRVIVQAIERGREPS